MCCTKTKKVKKLYVIWFAYKSKTISGTVLKVIPSEFWGNDIK